VRELLAHTVDGLRRRGAEYAEARHLVDEREQLSMRDQRVEQLHGATSEGFGVRVIVDGAWGFAARPGHSTAALERAAAEAVAVARAAASLMPGARVRLAAEEPCTGEYATAVDEDPFAVPLEDKLALCARRA
jgi:TldD protein